MSTIRLNRKCSKVVEITLDILSNVRKSSGNCRKSSEAARTFSEIPLMTRQKSHTFDSEKVGRYSAADRPTIQKCRSSTEQECYYCRLNLSHCVTVGHSFAFQQAAPS